jgi:predicted branched-subunit amino acid permease
MLARQAGLSTLEALLMSGLVNAGSAQFVALGFWHAPLPILQITAMTLVVNLRHVLMGAAVRPWFARLAILPTYGSLFFMGDENWALSMR